jgi:hypothetical protein
MRKQLILSSFSRRENWGIEKQSNLPRSRRWFMCSLNHSTMRIQHTTLRNNSSYYGQVINKTRETSDSQLYICTVITWLSFHLCLTFSSSILGAQSVFFLPWNAQIWWTLCWENQKSAFNIWKFHVKTLEAQESLRVRKSITSIQMLGFFFFYCH